MTPEIAFLFVLLAIMAYLFLTEKLPVDLTAFLGLVVLTLVGYVTPAEAFTGFSSPAVITMMSVFIVSAALLHTGVADRAGGFIYTLVGSREIPLTVILMAIAGLLSAFMNNIAATAVLLPAVGSIAYRSGIPPSRLFMPLAFGAILGGTTTLVGTPPNILGGTIMRERGLEPFGLFDFTPVGLALLAAGILFMVTLGQKLLPRREVGPVTSGSSQLSQVYQLHERLFSIRIPPQSRLDGISLGESRLGTALGIKVVAILRRARKRLVPEPGTFLRSGDVLLVEGNRSDLRDLMKVRDLTLQETTAGQLPRPVKGVTGVRLQLPDGSGLPGRSLREVHFRKRFGVVVVAIHRGDEYLKEDLAKRTLRENDELLALGARAHLERLRSQSDLRVREVGLSVLRNLWDQLFVIRVPEGSALVGSTVGNSRIGELAGVTVGAIIRGGMTHLGVFADAEIREGDGLLVAGDPEQIVGRLGTGDVDLDPGIGGISLETDDMGLAEAALAPRSSLVGRTLNEVKFRDRFGLQILAVWREGRPIHSGLADLALRFGDALLLQGPWDRIRHLELDADLVLFSRAERRPRRTRKAPFALAGLLVMVAMVVSGFQPIHVAAFTAASLVLLFGTLTMEEAYRAIEWRAIFLVAAVLAFGSAMEHTGAALLLANAVTGLAGSWGEYGILAALVLLTSLMSQGLDGAPAVVLLAPVALNAGAQMGLDPYTVMMSVSLAASAAFMTPFSHKANLLVMGAGGYRSIDYIRVGTPLTVVILILLVFLVPIFSPSGS